MSQTGSIEEQRQAHIVAVTELQNGNVNDVVVLLSSIECYRKDGSSWHHKFRQSYKLTGVHLKTAIGAIEADHGAVTNVIGRIQKSDASAINEQSRAVGDQLTKTSATIKAAIRNWGEFLKATQNEKGLDSNLACAEGGVSKFLDSVKQAGQALEKADPELGYLDGASALKVALARFEVRPSVRYLPPPASPTTGPAGKGGSKKTTKPSTLPEADGKALNLAKGSGLEASGPVSRDGGKSDLKSSPAPEAASPEALRSEEARIRKAVQARLDERKKEQQKKLELLKAQIKPIPTPLAAAEPPHALLTADEKAKVAAAGVRSPGELAQVARQRLADFAAGTLKSDVEFGDFFLESEFSEKNPPDLAVYQALLAKWLEAKKDYIALAAATPGDELAKISAVARAMNLDYLWSYSRDNARLSDLLSGKGGNCEANTLFILGGMRAIGLVPPGMELGTLVYDDHVEAVLYDPKTDQALSLLTGKKAQPDTDVFRPEIYYHSFLASKSKTVEVSAEKLMLRMKSGAEEKRAKTVSGSLRWVS